MEIIDKIYTYISNLDEKRFYQYLIGFLCTIGLLMLLIMFQYYRSVSSLKSEIAQINVAREQARTILDKGQIVKKEQREIDAIIAKDENFKIGQYFEDLLAKLGLSNKVDKDSLEVSSPEREGKYREEVLTAKFSGMTMKELTELLQELEFNKRVFTKELEITASQKPPNSIDVTLTIATLEPKPKDSTEIEE
ncbi:hypothetical protein E3J61_02380 [Candidatus Dependentiae bacterium]|nr:MAG: hypothetical protein E3J61_02380 [Candidatus Dependentiae bacterium]